MVKLANEANKELVDKYKAQSQTVVIVSKKKKKEVPVDDSDLVNTFAKDNDQAKFEMAFAAKINEGLK